MASVSVLFLVMSWVGPVWSLVLVWLLLLVFAHVFGNAWGTRARQRNDSKSFVEVDVVEPRQARPAPLAADPSAVRLRHTAVFRPFDFVAIGAAAVLGGGLGGSALWATYWNRAGYSAILVGAVSSAIIGGFLGFLCVTFLRVAVSAAADARHSTRGDCHKPTPKPAAPGDPPAR
jgi:hypothetical protein